MCKAIFYLFSQLPSWHGIYFYSLISPCRFYLVFISATSETPRTPSNWISTKLRTFSPSMTRPESCSRQFPSLYHFVRTMYTCESIIREIDGDTELHKRGTGQATDGLSFMSKIVLQIPTPTTNTVLSKKNLVGLQ